jgi:hypothetical protein
VWYILTKEDLDRLQPLSPTWLGKSAQTVLDYETVIELVAERAHATSALVKRLNPKTDWMAVHAGTVLTVPAVTLNEPLGKAALIHISLSRHTLEVRDAEGRLVGHFPVSIAHMAEKRPEGELHVTVVIPDPNYTFDPEVFPESPEGRQLGRKLVLPPGPNNPVGVAWIGLDRTGYGIHGPPRLRHPRHAAAGVRGPHRIARLLPPGQLGCPDPARPGLGRASGRGGSVNFGLADQPADLNPGNWRAKLGGKFGAADEIPSAGPGWRLQWRALIKLNRSTIASARPFGRIAQRKR